MMSIPAPVSDRLRTRQLIDRSPNWIIPAFATLNLVARFLRELVRALIRLTGVKNHKPEITFYPTAQLKNAEAPKLAKCNFDILIEFVYALIPSRELIWD
jgi:hypothetical protein